MKEYLSFEGLSRFLDNLVGKFSVIGHKHTKDEITDFNELNVYLSDDDNGNVELTIASGTVDSSTLDFYNNKISAFESQLNNCNNKVNTIETNVNALNSVINDNDILVVNNTSN